MSAHSSRGHSWQLAIPPEDWEKLLFRPLKALSLSFTGCFRQDIGILPLPRAVGGGKAAKGKSRPFPTLAVPVHSPCLSRWAELTRVRGLCLGFNCVRGLRTCTAESKSQVTQGPPSTSVQETVCQSPIFPPVCSQSLVNTFRNCGGPWCQ